MWSLIFSTNAKKKIWSHPSPSRTDDFFIRPVRRIQRRKVHTGSHAKPSSFIQCAFLASVAQPSLTDLQKRPHGLFLEHQIYVTLSLSAKHLWCLVRFSQKTYFGSGKTGEELWSPGSLCDVKGCWFLTSWAWELAEKTMPKSACNL